MNTDILDDIIECLSLLHIPDTLSPNEAAIKIQKLFRGYICRAKRLPLIMYYVQKYLQEQHISFCTQSNDGRINSCFDEDKLIELLSKKFYGKIKKPKCRMWYDVLLFDTIYGWIPVNIKSTTTKTSDNTGNLAMCVYAYTDEILNIHSTVSYKNGEMSKLLINKLKNKQYNYSKKDYFFIVINKTDTTNIIINSVKGLSVLTHNINNLPFQIKWCKNNTFKYDVIRNKINLFIECINKRSFSWKEQFIMDAKNLKCI